jgi:hypothetical protein
LANVVLPAPGKPQTMINLPDSIPVPNILR